ncbi:HAD-like domain-containing protein [Schizophyllum amplum]|uniref:HAD-like domain-containing protein n=1 Tax=Schizophyllum amplum TaxID=97359 RepID=A0A550CG24_9AGAR|nr:HAD-like domain-containing protein [Auriculariopsis ampla]
MPAIKCILFDCDNTLVLSEPLAFASCADLLNEILEKHGRSERFTGPELMSTFVGQNFRGMMTSLQEKYDFTMTDTELDTYVSRELDHTVEKLEAAAEPCAGAIEELERLQATGKYKLAVVSSSALSRVQASLKKVGMERFFAPENVYSAASSLPTPTSKPNPAIYLHACKELGYAPGECVAIEDSKSGATAAKNAHIPLVGYVGPYEEEEERVKMRKVLSEACEAFAILEHWKDFEQVLKKLESA